jgi:hypothetical protein
LLEVVGEVLAAGHFEDAKACYERTALARSWDVLVAEVRGAHRRKAGFMADFERLVAGQGPSDEPSFLPRAREAPVVVARDVVTR